MRIDASQILAQGGIKVNAKTDSITKSLKEGDIIKAQVLSSEKGSVVMKTEGGQTFKAALGADVALMPGDKVLLEVSGKEKGLILLSAGGSDDVLEGSSGQAGKAQNVADKSLEPYMNKLAELKMPVSESAARLMRELIEQYPEMKLDEAAFLATNKLNGNEGLMKAALAILSGGEKTDDMIARLLALLKLPDPAGESGVRSLESGIESRVPPSAAQPADAAVTQNFPLSSLISLLSAPDVGGVHGQSPEGSMQGLQTIIPQNDSIMQSINVENLKEITQNGEKNYEQQDFVLKNTQLPGPPNTVNPEIGARNPESAALLRGAPLQEPALVPAQGNAELQTRISEAPPPKSPLSTLPSQLTALLAEIPEFRGTPPQALERFSGMLLRVAGESAGTTAGETEKLEAQIDKLFTRIGKGDADAGARLRGAREELFARLALIEEAVSRASPPAKAEMLGQTHRLMEHVKVLNSIEQFAYMQLPVQLAEERRTAELYVFKKKGGRKPDPENVNILLSLDLENMGHWESLLNIRKKDVSIQMEVRGAAEKEHFSENTVMLHELLAEAGFKLVNTGITYSEKETTPLTALSSLGRYTAGRSGAIDFWI